MRILTKIVDYFAMPYSLFLLFKDPQFSWKAKLKAGLIMAGLTFYILYPMDIIPDFIPFAGWLDDLIIIPLVMAAAGKIAPEVNLARIRQKARGNTKRIMLWTTVCIVGLLLSRMVWIGALVYFGIKTWT